MRTVRSLIFAIAMPALTTMAVFAFLPTLALPKRMCLVAVRSYMRALTWLEETVVGIRSRLIDFDRIPDGACLIACKHQSTWETLKIHLWFPDPGIVLKRELLRIPIFGWYCRKADLIPVDRSRGRRSVESLVNGARRMRDQGRKIVIFPQGTRLAPDQWRPYKVGVFAIYQATGLPCVPVALNSGCFWGRKQFLKTPGTITVQALEPIPPGLDQDRFMALLEQRLEPASEALAVAAGWPPVNRPEGAATAAESVSV